MQLGEETSIIFDYIMGHDMEGTHLFRFTVSSNDPVEPKKDFHLKIDYVLSE